MRASNLLASALLATCAVVAVACGGGSNGGQTPPPTYSISGTVTGASAVTVTLSGAGTSVTTTDGSGAYSFAGLSNGGYTVTPSKAGFTFAPPSRAVTVSGASVPGQGFAATPTHSISGTVTGTTAVTVTLSGARTATTTTDANGTYAFHDLADGAYTVTPSKAGFTFAPANRPVTVSGADVTGQDFVGSPIVVGTHAISGTVTGTVIQGVTVTLRAAPGGSTVGSATTDAAGAYAFSGLSDGGYSVTPSLLDPSGTFHVFSPPRRQVTVSGADVTGQGFGGTPLVDYEGFSGPVSGTRWDTGEHQAILEVQQATLGSAVDAPAANTAYGASLVVAPGAVTGRTTKVETVVRVAASDLTGDAVGRAGIDLLFQPLADRVASPDNQTNALYVRVALQGSSAGLVAVRQAFRCTVADCTATLGVGTVVAGGTAWPGDTGLGNIALDTPYTISISFDTAQHRFTFSLRGGAHTTAVTTTLDLSAVAATLDNDFFRTRLLTHVRGGAQGGAGTGGSIFALFDDVAIGVNGQASTLFDDFNTGTGTMFDPGRWTVGGAAAQIFSGALEVRLLQQDSPEVSGLTLIRGLVPAPSALQARVRVQAYNKTGAGQVGARLAAVLYNDGSPGVGPAPDVNQASSQVGDVIAQISVSDTDVSYAVIRCNVAVCTGPKATGNGVTFVVPRTSLRTTAVGTMHNLLLRWDAQSHQVVFQVDGLPAAVVDPTAGATGVPVVSGPHRELWQLSNHAGASAQGVDFTTGSEANIQSLFELVKKL